MNPDISSRVIEKLLKQTNDSTLQNPTTPPYLIRTDGQNPEPVILQPEAEEEGEPTV